jgi:hypothetical protein
MKEVSGKGVPLTPFFIATSCHGERRDGEVVGGGEGVSVVL